MYVKDDNQEVTGFNSFEENTVRYAIYVAFWPFNSSANIHSILIASLDHILSHVSTDKNSAGTKSGGDQVGKR